MIGKVWSAMIIISFICAIFTNKLNDLGNAIIEGTNQSLNIVLITAGSIIFWSGIMKIAQNSGFTKAISRLLFPVLKFLFPECANKEKILDSICINIVSNMLGLSNAATPSGIKAIREMKKEEVSFENISTFLMMNMSCIQLAPSFLVALRKSLGSNNPYIILPKMWMSSLVFLMTGIFLVKISKIKCYQTMEKKC
jgi:spore maturation protein A